MNDVQVKVTLYIFDTGSDFLLGQDFLNDLLLVTFGKGTVTFNTSGGPVSFPSSSDYQIRVQPTDQDLVYYNLQDLTKINRIVKNAELHGPKTLEKISNKLRKDCTASRPDAFWTREKYFVALPYKENYVPKPQKANANHMSPSEQDLCRQEIAQLLEQKLTEPCKSPWACPAFYVNKHGEKKRGKKWLVINYKALNDALLPICYPLPNKELLLAKIANVNVFSKFDLKSGFW